MNAMEMTRDEVMEHFDYNRKVIILGNSGVGKTKIFRRLNQDKFVQNEMQTFGVSWTSKILRLEDNTRMKVQVWDTAGQEKYRSLTKGYYKNTHGVILVFALDDSKSFDSVQNWIEELSEQIPATPLILLGNKNDLQRTVSEEDIRRIIQKHNVCFIECSAKSGHSVHQAFFRLACLMHHCRKKGETLKQDPVDIQHPHLETQKGCCAAKLAHQF